MGCICSRSKNSAQVVPYQSSTKDDKKCGHTINRASKVAPLPSNRNRIKPEKVNDVTIWGCTPPDKGVYISMEETFWSTKRKLIPDFSVMERIDAHVLSVMAYHKVVRPEQWWLLTHSKLVLGFAKFENERRRVGVVSNEAMSHWRGTITSTRAVDGRKHSLRYREQVTWLACQPIGWGGSQ